MLHRLSPRDTTVVDFLGVTVDGGLPSDRSAGAVETAAFWFASCKTEGAAAGDDPPAWPGERFAAVVPAAVDGSSACAWIAPELGAVSASATATLCLDSVCLPSGSRDLSVSA